MVDLLCDNHISTLIYSFVVQTVTKETTPLLFLASCVLNPLEEVCDGEEDKDGDAHDEDDEDNEETFEAADEFCISPLHIALDALNLALVCWDTFKVYSQLIENSLYFRLPCEGFKCYSPKRLVVLNMKALSRVQHCKSLTHLMIGAQCTTIPSPLPSSITHLTTVYYDSHEFPPQLVSLEVSEPYQVNLWKLPTTLKHLGMVSSDSDPHFPDSLTSLDILTLSGDSPTSLPPALTHLTLRDVNYNLPLPQTLTHLSLIIWGAFDHKKGLGFSFPSSLTHFKMQHSTEDEENAIVLPPFPPTLEVLDLEHSDHIYNGDHIKLPPSLKYLALHSEFEGTISPEDVLAQLTVAKLGRASQSSVEALPSSQLKLLEIWWADFKLPDPHRFYSLTHLSWTFKWTLTGFPPNLEYLKLNEDRGEDSERILPQLPATLLTLDYTGGSQLPKLPDKLQNLTFCSSSSPLPELPSHLVYLHVERTKPNSSIPAFPATLRAFAIEIECTVPPLPLNLKYLSFCLNAKKCTLSVIPSTNAYFPPHLLYLDCADEFARKWIIGQLSKQCMHIKNQ